jgi:hypothetical protein
VHCSLLRLPLVLSVPAWPVIWLLPVFAPSAGLSFASSNGQLVNRKKKEPRERLCLVLILLETTAAEKLPIYPVTARLFGLFGGWN